MDNKTHNGSLVLGRLFLQLRQLERQPRHFGNIGPYSDSRATVISLTDEGKEAYYAHEADHLKFYSQL